MKIAIVNDTPMLTEAMRRALAAAGWTEIIWTAQDGAKAIEKCREQLPDLILMDLAMPIVDGVAATRSIMAENPCAILIVTETMEGHCGRIFEAMGAGALDVAGAPGLDGEAHSDETAGFLRKIEAVARLIGGTAPKSKAASIIPGERLVAIGSSAGGPAALTVLLRGLPADFPAAVVIVQHVDAHFAPGLAKWLGESSNLPVRTAMPGEAPMQGAVLLASSNDHLIFESPRRLGYTPDPVNYSYRPSVNAFFESAAHRWHHPIIGVLLTGMGSDGASGLKTLRNLGHHTIAQDRASSAVYGMPKAAAELNAATEVLPLEQIAPALLNHFSPQKSAPPLPAPSPVP